MSTLLFLIDYLLHFDFLFISFLYKSIFVSIIFLRFSLQHISLIHFILAILLLVAISTWNIYHLSKLFYYYYLYWLSYYLYILLVQVYSILILSFLLFTESIGLVLFIARFSSITIVIRLYFLLSALSFDQFYYYLSFLFSILLS